MDCKLIIENALEENKITKRDLYNMIVDTYYDGVQKKYTTYASMAYRIVENKMYADEFMYAAALLDIDVSRMYGYIKNKVDEKAPRVAKYIEKILIDNSRYFYEGMDVEVISTNVKSSYKNDRYYLLLTDVDNKIVTLELFDLDEKYSISKIKLNFKNEASCKFEKFHQLELVKKIEYLNACVKEKECVLNTYEMNNELDVVLPKITWDVKIINPADEINRDEFEVDEKSLKKIMDGLKKDISKKPGYGMINKKEIVEIEGYIVSFTIIDDIARYKDKTNVKLIVKVNELTKGY